MVIDEDISLRLKMSLLRLQPSMKSRIRRMDRVRRGDITVKEKMEIEKRQRDKYFKQVLLDLKTEPFYRKWILQSRKSMPQILDYLASSLGTMEGFELANRAMRENLSMPEAGIDLDAIEDFLRKASRISLFEFVLLKNNVSPKWANLAMTMFVAKEFGSDKPTSENIMMKQVMESLKVMAGKKVEGPYPQRRARVKPEPKKPKKIIPVDTPYEES